MEIDDINVLKTGKIEGKGKDPAGPFTIDGSIANGKFHLIKTYKAHKIYYRGTGGTQTHLSGTWGFKENDVQEKFDLKFKIGA